MLRVKSLFCFPCSNISHTFNHVKNLLRKQNEENDMCDMLCPSVPVSAMGKGENAHVSLQYRPYKLKC